MTSKRQTLIDEIKIAIEGNGTVYGSGNSLINKVVTEPEPVGAKMQQNTLIIAPGRRSGDRIDVESETNETIWDFTLVLEFKQIKRESNDSLYQVVENLWKLFNKHTLNGNALDSRVTDDDPQINKDNQTVLDGFELFLEIKTLEVL